MHDIPPDILETTFGPVELYMDHRRYNPNTVTGEFGPLDAGWEDPIAPKPQAAPANPVDKIVEERGAIYGHPSVDFDRAVRLHEVIDECPHKLARHSLRMIGVKIARLIQSPDHKDSWLDIAGYAKTGLMVTEKKGAFDPRLEDEGRE